MVVVLNYTSGPHLSVREGEGEEDRMERGNGGREGM